jgi:hypothetical protein
MDIQVALAVDILILVLSLWCILQVTQRSIFNPCLWWVALHAYTVTLRLITLNLGAESLSLIGVRSNVELVRAAIASDISLMAVVVATIVVEHRALRDRAIDFPDGGRDELNPRFGNVISILCLTIGTFFLLRFASTTIAARARGIDLTTIDIGNIAQTTYPNTIAGFAVQAGLIQVALRGFTRWTIALLILLMALTSLYLPRASFVLAAIMAFLIYQTQHKMTNLPAKWAFGALLLGLVWFVYKPVAAAINDDLNAEQVIASAQDYFRDAVSGNSSGDVQFFDMEATYMAASDETGQRFYGSTILPLLYLPIPRYLWPDKPRVNEYAFQLSSPLRPMTQVGMTPLLSGESYLNFGWTGCAVIPFLYILGMQTAFHWVRDHGSASIGRLIYTIFLLSMIPVFRDGLASLVIFPIVWYLPIVGWGVISKLMPSGKAYAAHFNQR